MTQVLRHGIDSLYLSLPGQLSETSQALLAELKELAQNEREAMAAAAVLPIGEHRFCVASHGRRRFAFVIEDNWFSIALASSTARSLPMAHCQISSELLTAVCPTAALDTLTDVAEQLGSLSGPAMVSRADLFADFTTPADFIGMPGQNWIKRCHKRAIFEDRDAFTGVAFGLGGSLSCRIYDKTLEIERSEKHYLRPLWEAAGWNGRDAVWRLEFQLRREVLVELQAGTLPALLARLTAIWSYLTTDWLRLAVPNPDDDTRTRWPTHSDWSVLAALDGTSAPSAVRVRRERIPEDATLFRPGLAGVTSFMAREGIDDFEDGLRAFIHAASAYHREMAQRPHENALHRYVQRKVTAKQRRFNTITRHEPE
ncbi:MAG: replication initiation factor [Xanthomonadaceae bacterium]|nr:replication initiation factor [Xanthomonadaceae bacterium]